MPDWLAEGDPAIYGLLAAALAAFLALWWRTRKRALLIAAGGIAALILGYFLLDHFVETDGKQMIRKVREVAAAVSDHNVDAAFRHVSEQFNRHGADKKQFKTYCEQHISRGEVTAVQVWDLNAVDISRPNKTGTVEFRFKVHGGWGESPPNWFGRVFFTLDDDGQWRVKDFDVYDALNQSKAPIPIPGWK